jgi:hypothetical protein
MKELLDRIADLSNDIHDYIANTEHCLFYWIDNKQVQDFIREYPEDYDDMWNMEIVSIATSVYVKIHFHDHPDGIENIYRYAALSTFRDSTYAKWMKWNGNIKGLQIKKTEEELKYYQKKLNETKKTLEELKEKDV